MALTREFLRSLGLDADKIETIITNHAESIDALKEQSEKYKNELEELSPYKNKFLKEEKAFKEFKEKIQNEKIYNAKKGQLSDYLKEKGITEDTNLKLALGYLDKEINNLQLKDEKIESFENIDNYLTNDLKNLIKTEETTGAEVEKPEIEPEEVAEAQTSFFI